MADLPESETNPRVLPEQIPKSVWLFSGIAMVVALVEIQFAEQSWAFFYDTVLTQRLTGLLTAANQFPEFLTIAAIGIAVWIHRPEFRHTLLSMALAIGFASLFTGIVKDITGRARPTSGLRIIHHENRLEERKEFIAEHPETILKAENGDYWLIKSPASVYFSKDRPWFEGEFASFPSGHATSAFAFAVWLAILFPRGRWLWYTLAILTCMARVRFRRHHPGDVIAGAVVGYVTAWLVLTSPWFTKQGLALSRTIERFAPWTR